MSQVEVPELPAIGSGAFSFEERPLWEVVDGQEVDLPIMGFYEGSLASFLCRKLGNSAEEKGTGRVVMEVLFHIHAGKSNMRRPDVAFVSFERWGRDRKMTAGNGWDVVPDLAVEVVSPTDLAVEVISKVFEYLAAGVVRVWLIYPGVRRVLSFDAAGGCRVVGPDGSLDGEALVPGFQLPLAELFRDGPDV